MIMVKTSDMMERERLEGFVFQQGRGRDSGNPAVANSSTVPICTAAEFHLLAAKVLAGCQRDERGQSSSRSLGLSWEQFGSAAASREWRAGRNRHN